MPTPYRAVTIFQSMSVLSDQDMVLEIGSERGEGSSKFLHDWAIDRHVEFRTVDVIDKPQLTNSGINFEIATSGSIWCAQVLPTLNKKIKVLYLDNFDYQHDMSHWIDKAAITRMQKVFDQQIQEYAARGVVMNNENCQDEHLSQVQHCLPFMADESVIIMDDTDFVQSAYDRDLPVADCWIGKCAKAIPVLMENFYTISRSIDHCSIFAYRRTVGEYHCYSEFYGSR